MRRRSVLGASYGTAFLLLLGLSPLSSRAQQSTLQVCVIQHVGDVCGGDTTPPAPTPPAPTGGAGGGGGGGVAASPLQAFNPVLGQVFFNGTAYPDSHVTLARDGQFLAETTAGPDAQFQFTISGVTPGAYTYSVWSEDARAVRSLSKSFTVSVSPGVGTVISGIFLPPTIEVDKSQVKRGDPITLLGASAPSAQVSVVVHSAQELVKSTLADKNGVWKYVLDTLELEYGSHDASARSKNAVGLSPLSAAVSFVVGDTTVLATAEKKSASPAVDLNADGRVDIADFSILAYWYKRPLTVAGYKADLNHDGKVDLKDFSILAYYWTS